MLSPRNHNRGYLYVSLFLMGVSRNFYIHRLVTASFLGPIPEGMTVNHKDGNKHNNNFDNLEYVSNQRNLYHARDMGLLKYAKLSMEKAEEIRTLYSTCEYSSASLAEIYGVSPTTIDYVLSGKIWRPIESIP